MHPFAHYAIAGSILTSALGALLLYLLVFRYGFPPRDDEPIGDRHRRFFVTRLGHAAGAVCFALTAGLAGVALGLPSPATVVPTPLAATPDDVAALREADARADRDMRALDQRVARAEAAIERVRAMVVNSSTKLARRERARASSPVEPTSPETRSTELAQRGVPVPTPRAVAVPALPSPTEGSALPLAATLPSAPAPDVATAAPAPGIPEAQHFPAASDDAPAVSAPDVAAPEPVVPGAAPARPTETSYAPAGERSFAETVSQVGTAIVRGFVSAGRGVRRFVEELQ